MENIKKENSMSFIRHSKAEYKTYKKIRESDNPQQAVDYDNQVENDLPPAGVELAKSEAEKFFDNLNPKEDALFFVSSEEMRALETANIYKNIAKERGFEIIKPYKDIESDKPIPSARRESVVHEVGDGEIRKLDTLSLNIKNMLIHSIFKQGKKYLDEINWEAVDKNIKEKWLKAREIIDADDKGSWGANFYHHSEEIKKIFPEIQTSKDAYERKFKNITKLIKFADQKIKDADHYKNIKVLGFGHENYMGYALDKYFNSYEIKNCEAIGIKVDNDDILFKHRNKEEKIN